MKEMLKNSWLGLTLLVLVIVWLGIYGVYNTDFFTGEPKDKANNSDVSSGDAKALAQCLTNKGFKLYGATWCGHCQDQKKMFGEAVALINYIECATVDNNGQTEACDQAGIEMYPTWVYPDGTKVPGVMTLKDLAKVSSCPTV